MSARRRPSPTAPRPQTTENGLLFQSSTAGWFAEWKARKSATAAVPADPATTPPPADDASEALARWLTGNAGQ